MSSPVKPGGRFAREADQSASRAAVPPRASTGIRRWAGRLPPGAGLGQPVPGANGLAVVPAVASALGLIAGQQNALD
ncbi:MAG TPA: hypothetical protein VI365_29370 [Trebonia sp.]